MKDNGAAMRLGKNGLTFVITLFLAVCFIVGGTTSSVMAATLTTGETGTSVSKYLGKSKDGKGWKNPHIKNCSQFKYTVKIGGTERTGYCMEPGKNFGNGHKYTSKTPAKVKAWNSLSDAKQRVLALVLYYGYNQGKSAPYGNTNDYYAATQVLVWEAVDGDITLSSSGKWSKKSNTHDNLISGRTYAEKNYKWIKENITAHVKGAAFTKSSLSSAATYVMKYNYSSKQWSRVLTDTAKGNYLKRSNGTTDSLSVSRTGYSYTFKTSSQGTKNAVLVNDQSSGTAQAMLILQAGRTADQSVIFGATDYTKFYVKLRTEEKGTGKIVKTSDDGKVDGFRFKVTCSENGYSAVHTTDSKGTITMSLYPGEYAVKEELTEEQKNEGYLAAGTQKIVIKENTVTSLKIHNKKKPQGSSILIEKENDDGASPSGFKFCITHLATGKSFECETDETGTAVLENMDKGDYTVEEILTEEQKKLYEEPERQTVSVTEDGQMVSVKFLNKAKTTHVKLRKTCVDGNVSGIEFHVSGELLDGDFYGVRTVVTGEDGSADLGELKPGTYTIEEVVPDIYRYLPKDPVTVTVTGDENEDIEIEYENVPTSLYITKVDAATGEFLAGAEFELLDSAGNRLMGFSVIMEDGRVSLQPAVVDSELLVYDDPENTDYGCLRGLSVGQTYVLKEICPPEGYMSAEDIEFVFEEGMEIAIKNEEIEIPAPAPSEPEPAGPVPEPEEETQIKKEPDEIKPGKIVETNDLRNLLLPMGVAMLAITVICMLFFRREKLH